VNAADFADRLEMPDGALPTSAPLDASLQRKIPLAAFGILAGGDAFDVVNGKPPPEGKAKAKAYTDAKVTLERHGAEGELAERVLGEIRSQLSGNLQLIARLTEGRPLTIDLIPPGKSMAQYGYPKGVSRSASGLFWDHPDWPRARIALRVDRLHEPALVVHEMAHAIQYLAFTQEERDAIYRVMLRTYRYKNHVDEVFAIYSEREFLEAFGRRERAAPGVYGMARQRWNEDHVFTRFVRNLYFPYKPLAGPKLGSSGGLAAR
jgi:hypothetical protein